MTDIKNNSKEGEEKSSPLAEFQEMQMEVQSKIEGTLSRSRIRNLLFKLKDRRVFPEEVELAQAVFKIFSEQFKPGMGLATFTFTWDVGVTDPFKLIEEHEWEEAGGRYDEEMMARNVRLRRPAAFTQQK